MKARDNNRLSSFAAAGKVIRREQAGSGIVEKIKKGDRVKLVKKITDLPSSWIGRTGTVISANWGGEAVSVRMDLQGGEKKERVVFTMAANFKLIKPKGVTNEYR
ncbi:MAG: hypothetical protein Kow0098_03340 [Ignavibacteriaceae bacterium]